MKKRNFVRDMTDFFVDMVTFIVISYVMVIVLIASSFALLIVIAVVPLWLLLIKIKKSITNVLKGAKNDPRKNLH